MRRSLLLALLASFFIATATTVAQDKAQEPLKGLQGLLGVQSGDYKFFHFDKGLLQKNYLDVIFKDREEDRAYFLSTVTTIEKDFKDLMAAALFNAGEAEVVEDPKTKTSVLKFTKRGGLVWMSQQSTGLSAFIKPADFLASVNYLYQARLQLETRIATLTAIQEGALPSQTKLKAEGSGLEDVPNYGKMDFGPIRKFYEGKLAEILAVADKLEFNIVLVDGSKHINAGLVLPQGVLKLSREEIEKMTEQMVDLRSWDAKSYDTINDYTKYQRQFMQDFISTYAHRWYKLPAAELAQRPKDAKLIADGFWTRSYLRAVYGMPIGAIGIDYSPQVANLDFLTTSTNALGRFHEQPAWKERDLLRIDQNFRNCLERAGVRAEKISDGNLGYLATGENLLTYLGGKRNQAQAQLMMLSLLSADMYEERLIQQAGGIAKMKARFRDRYLRSDDDRKYYKQLAQDYDPQGADTATGINAASVLGQFRKVRAKMTLKEVDLASAAQLENTVNMATGANRFATDRKARIDDLFGPDKP